MSAGTAAYEWVSRQGEKLPDIAEVHSNAEHGIDAGLDDAIKWFLDKVGLMEYLERVTGMPSQLTAAAQEWKAQGEALQKVAEGLRAGARSLPDQWQGEASDSFGRGMGRIVDAIDGTGEEMGQTAQILSQAAAECKLAEDTIVAIIREAIEWAVMTLAAMVITDILTLGLATVVDGLVAEAEVAVFIARVERVSAKLAKTLEELMKAVREMKQGEKSFKRINEARKVAAQLRKRGGIMDADRYRTKDWWAHHIVTGQIKGHGSVPILNGLTGLTGEIPEPAKEALGSDTAKRSWERDGKPAADKPYRVPKGSIEDTFG
ncbi:WXG100 family type VII secretion target [Streptomyces sp. MST-110588]|uniref:WXG100 family type VII secretion target n=1 Tax=Streptomyces sp. MST-110588 TaxID=2833628 RepID=UPI001F5D0B04|nr:WXG100 family type VII secretion target [Streptomyces sp. MST-110588]UNO39648.1 WXG100 family type VII secretion target [Streptomyces sp. MST-110588]